jgi:outer membrane protein TolC
MHDTTRAPYRIGEDIRRTANANPSPPLAAPWSRAVARRPELAALDAARGANEKSARAEKAGYGPRLGLFANAEYSRPNQRIFPTEDPFHGGWDAGAQLTWMLSDIPAADARSRSAEAKARKTAADRDALGARIVARVAAVRLAYATGGSEKSP